MDNTLVDAYQAEINKDDWHSVTDAKKRKQIQDRLAQRIRRKRLREAKENTNQMLLDPEMQQSRGMQVDDHSLRVSTVTYRLISHDALPQIPRSRDVTQPLSPQSLSTRPSPLPGQAPTIHHDLPYPTTVITALFLNGQIMGLFCHVASPAKSLPVSAAVPLPLHPTPTQLRTVHATGIDRFPFPRMRDNVINLSSIVDVEEFSLDLFTMPSFAITPGAATWDPRAWRIERPFAEKWGFLFY